MYAWAYSETAEGKTVFLRFCDEYFFNTFRDDLEDSSMEDNIAVMKRKDGRNALMCEIRWKHPPLD
jgi:hypothetical protein